MSILAALALAASLAHAQTFDEHAALFAQYVKVVNAGDVAGLRAMISDDVERLDYRGCTPALSNKNCLLYFIDTTVIKQHGRIEATPSFGVEGDTMIAGLVLRSDRVRAAGSERAYGIDRIKVKDGKIAALAFVPNLQDPQTRKFYALVRSGATASVRPYLDKELKSP